MSSNWFRLNILWASSKNAMQGSRSIGEAAAVCLPFWPRDGAVETKVRQAYNGKRKKKGRKSKSWWGGEVREAIKERQEASREHSKAKSGRTAE